MRDSIAIHITYAGIASRKLLGCIHFFCTHLPVRCMFLVGIFDYMVPHVEHYMVIHSSPYDAAPSPFILFLFYTSTRRAHRLWKGLSIQLFIDLFHSISINWSGPTCEWKYGFYSFFFQHNSRFVWECAVFFLDEIVYHSEKSVVINKYNFPLPYSSSLLGYPAMNANNCCSAFLQCCF